MIDAAARIVFTSGLVYSQQFPFSTCLIVDGGRIAWIGDDGGLAGQLLASDVQIDCDGALLTPAFFDSHMTAPGSVDSSVAGGFIDTADGFALRKRDADGRWVDHPTSNESAQLERLELPTDAVSQESISDMLADRKFAVVPPTIDTDSLSRLARAGVPFSFGSFGATTSPWEWMRSAVYGGTDGLSSRAAFNATTRSGWRLAGSPDAGELTIGTNASMCLWKCDHVEVQVPDARVRAWSTDVRAGTPPLPDLAPEAPLPELIATVTDGNHRSMRK